MSKLILPTNVYAKPQIETRSMPTLLEQRNTLLTNLDNIIKKAKEETRAMTDEENTSFETTKTEIEQIDKTLAAEEAAKKFNIVDTSTQVIKGSEAEEKRSMDEANFIKFIRGEERALDVAGNGGIIPSTIADRIIMAVKELCPIYQMATVFNVGGNLIFPKFDPNSITTAYVADMTPLTAANGNFTTITLNNFIAGSLTQISRSLMNRTDFDLVTFIVNNMAQSIATFLENQLLNGTGSSAATGIFVDASVTPVTAASATALSIDDLINTQMSIIEPFQANAAWIMNRTVFTAISKLKDSTGMPLLNRDMTQGYGWSLLGKRVYLSANAPGTMTTGLNVLAYGDYSGLYVKLAQNVEIQILSELYATSHALGCVGYIEFDSKVVEPQRLTRLKMA